MEQILWRRSAFEETMQENNGEAAPTEIAMLAHWKKQTVAPATVFEEPDTLASKVYCILFFFISSRNLSLRHRNPLNALSYRLCFTGAYDGRGFGSVPR